MTGDFQEKKQTFFFLCVCAVLPGLDVAGRTEFIHALSFSHDAAQTAGIGQCSVLTVFAL